MEDWIADLRNFIEENPLTDEQFRSSVCWGLAPSWNKGKSGQYTYEVLHKTYTIKKPDGSIEEISGLSPYCRKHNLNAGHLHQTLTGKRLQTKGYSIIPQTEEEIKRYNENRDNSEEGKKRKRRPGVLNGRAILNEDKVREIRKHHKEKTMTNAKLAEVYKVKKGTIEAIVYGKIWIDIL